MLWNSVLFSLSVILATIVSVGLCSKTDEQMMQSSITDKYGMSPVEYHSNKPLQGNQTVINKHVADILMPLMPYIREKRLVPPPATTLFNSISLTIADAQDDGPAPYPAHTRPDQPDLAELGSSPNRVLSALNQLIHLYEYKYDLVTSAQIGPFTFS